MEKRELVDQKDAARFERVRSYLVAHPALFSTQGSVVATWRTYRGRRLGPYFRVSYRERGRQRSMYLGCSERIARLVRLLLAHLQTRHRQRRLFARLIGQARSSLRACKADLKRQLAEWGIQLKGFEFRGAARLLRRRYPRTPPRPHHAKAGPTPSPAPGVPLPGTSSVRTAECPGEPHRAGGESTACPKEWHTRFKAGRQSRAPARRAKDMAATAPRRTTAPTRSWRHTSRSEFRSVSGE